MRTLSLKQLPLALFRAFDEHSAGLLREYTLALLGGTGQPFDLDDVTRAVAAKAQVAINVEGAAERTMAANPAGKANAALDVEVSPADVPAFSVLQGVLDHANRLAYVGDLLVLPSLPEVVALRNWICDQITAQSSGAAPQPWQLPSGAIEQPGRTLAAWRGMRDLPVDEAWLVGDDANRIIGASAPALELLGWAEEDLVGQRIVVVIPPQLRELHIAAFTRGLMTGTYHLLDKPLEIAAHTRDGRDVDVVLTLHQHQADRGRCVFLAQLERR